MTEIQRFLTARDLLVAQRSSYERAVSGFRWPRLSEFNWALDYFDDVADPDATALIVASDAGPATELTFAELTARSNQVAGYLRAKGLGRGDIVLLCLRNVGPLWEVMLAAIKLRLVVIPASPLLTPEDLADRMSRGGAKAIVTSADLAPRFSEVGPALRIVVGEHVDGWEPFEAYREHEPVFAPEGPTRADDPLLLYFTSGTTAQPKVVEHTHASYPIGHLSTMYALGLRAGDVHLNISSPGWAKHAWSCFFAPWNAGAAVLAYDYDRFVPRALLELLVSRRVTSLCAPPTVWRLLVQERLEDYPVQIREALSAGEPLNPEIIEEVRTHWGVEIRDFYGQTETTALVGNSPGQIVRPGSMGRALPGYQIELLDADGLPAEEGEICVRLSADDPPLGVMAGYRGAAELTGDATSGEYYRTGDVAARGEDGYITYVGRVDDVFKASDYRISPFELESVLIEHPSVAEAAVVPSPDERRTAVPKAFVALAAGSDPSAETAGDILRHCREKLAPYKRVRRLEFAELPKTISGKIRRVELRRAEEARGGSPERRAGEYWEQDFPQAVEQAEA